MTDNTLKKALEQYNCLVVCGPTASGKTGLGIMLAQRHNGEIISADSRQVYRDMDIGTGKDLDEYNTESGPVHYHLIDIADPMEIYNLYKYIEDFYSVFRDISARGRLPVVVGGSGLYLEAVLRHYHVANVPENSQLRDRLMEHDKDKLLLELGNYPEILSKTDTSSKKRIVRSLEIAEYGKTNPVEWGGQDPPLITPLVLCIYRPREELKKRINERLAKRLKEGMIDEVDRLLQQGTSRGRMMILGLEYKYITLYLLNELDYDEMVEKLRTAIHRFSKRQMTWFRGMEKRGLRLHWIRNGDLSGFR